MPSAGSESLLSTERTPQVGLGRSGGGSPLLLPPPAVRWRPAREAESADFRPLAREHLAAQAAGVGAADGLERERRAARLPGVVAAWAAGAAEPSADAILGSLLVQGDCSLNVKSTCARIPIEVVDIALAGGAALDRVEGAGVDQRYPASVEDEFVGPGWPAGRRNRCRGALPCSLEAR